MWPLYGMKPSALMKRNGNLPCWRKAYGRNGAKPPANGWSSLRLNELPAHLHLCRRMRLRGKGVVQLRDCEGIENILHSPFNFHCAITSSPHVFKQTH